MAQVTSIEVPVAAAEIDAARSARSAPTLKKVLRRLSGMPVGVASGVILLLIVLVAVFAPLVVPHDPYDSELINRLKPPVWEAGGTWEYILGTDQVGRDTLSRLIYGAQVSLMAGFFAMIISLVIG